MTMASKNGCLEVAKYMIYKGAKNFEECLEVAEFCGQLTMVDFFKYDV